MPYDLKKDGKCWVVTGPKGKVTAKCSTKKDAEAQIRLLMDKKSAKKGGMIKLSQPVMNQQSLIHAALSVLPLSQPALNTYSKFSGQK